MKKSTIKVILRKRIKALLETIDPQAKIDGFNIREDIKANAVITGGCIVSLLTGEKVNDYDIYFKDMDAVERIAKYYVDKFNKNKGKLKSEAMRSCNPSVQRCTKTNLKGESEDRVVIKIQSAGVAGENQSTYKYFEGYGEEESDDFIGTLNVSEENMEIGQNIVDMVKDKKAPKYRPIFMSENAISLTDKVQLIIRFSGDLDEIHRNYDFSHCMCSYDYSKHALILPSDALEAIITKTLIYKGSLYPLASLFRIRKFIKRGWSITAGQILKIAQQVGKIDFDNVEQLTEQLIGVDQAYMAQLIDEIQKNKDQKIDEIYLAKLIDEIFE